MAIRMKEWGMQQAPQSPVRIPVENLHGWVDATQRLGRGIVSSILGTQQLLQDEEKVTAEGELAAFSEQRYSIWLRVYNLLLLATAACRQTGQGKQGKRCRGGLGDGSDFYFYIRSPLRYVTTISIHCDAEVFGLSM